MSIISITGPTVFPDGVRFAAIDMDPESGSIVSVRPTNSAYFDQLLVFPGFIDIHVHAREYCLPKNSDLTMVAQWEAFCRKEKFVSAGEAAINGGVTLFCAMPNDPVPPDNSEVYHEKLALALSSPCPVILFGLVTAHSEPWGDFPYKVYLDLIGPPIAFNRWIKLSEVLHRYKGNRIFFHAEDPEILARYEGMGPRWQSRPPEAEIQAVDKVLDLTAKFGLATHICHISTAKALKKIKDYNIHSEKKVTCEVTPHHLYFSIQNGKILTDGKNCEILPHLVECNPPLRSEEDRLFLIEALKEGAVDVLASDHAPHTLKDKNGGAPGMPHLDTLGGFAGWLINNCGFPPERIAEILSSTPAKIFASDLEMVHGVIKEGATASLTILDLSKHTIVDGNKIKNRGPLKTLCGWSPFNGISLPAYVHGTIVRGTWMSQ